MTVEKALGGGGGIIPKMSSPAIDLPGFSFGYEWDRQMNCRATSKRRR